MSCKNYSKTTANSKFELLKNELLTSIKLIAFFNVIVIECYHQRKRQQSIRQTRQISENMVITSQQQCQQTKRSTFANQNDYNLSCFTKDQLIYRGEGNSSLVVGIQSTCQVIRMLKSDAKKLRNANDVLTHLLQHIDFNENILPDVLPEYLFSAPKLICLDECQLGLIKNFVKDKRPKFRLDKTLPNCGYALLMSDFCSIPNSLSFDWTEHSVLAIEIKPKQGFMPDSNLFCSNDFLRLKSRICRFGLSQFYKLQKQSIKEISSYCPLDLFSGCPSRTLYSLLCLIENPQNNFRVFLNSHLIYGDQSNIENLRIILDNFLQRRNPKAKQFRLNNFSNKKDTSINSLSSLGLLLLQILYKPLANVEDSKLRIHEKGNKNDYKYVPNVLRELENLETNDKYVFFKSFIQFFEKLSNILNEIQTKNDVNNNRINNELNLNIFMDLQLNLAFVYDNYIKDMFPNQSTHVKKFKIIKALMNVPMMNRNGSKCLLHQDNRFKKCCYHLNLDCICKDSSKHCLPSGCTLDSILKVQQLDTIDSFIAVEIFNKLYLRYKKLKQDLCTEQLYPCNGDIRLRTELKKFILQNIHELDTLWQFLISLTAKDCSIMIAMKRMDSNGNLLMSSSTTTISNDDKNNNQTTVPSLMPSIHVVDKNTGHDYMARVSIIDLDYKPACKIQRMLYNDRRMIYAFLNSFKLNNNNNLLSPWTLPIQLFNNEIEQ